MLPRASAGYFPGVRHHFAPGLQRAHKQVHPCQALNDGRPPKAPRAGPADAPPCLILWHPVSDEDIKLAWLLGVAGGGEDQLLAIRGEYREAIEAGAVGEPPRAGAVHVDAVQGKRAPLRVMQVRGEDD